ncbi:hypothetical protein D3C85_999650 [compost metagenome]
MSARFSPSMVNKGKRRGYAKHGKHKPEQQIFHKQEALVLAESTENLVHSTEVLKLNSINLNLMFGQ